MGNETLLLVYKSGEVILYCISSISFAFEKDVKNFLSLEELLLSNKDFDSLQWENLLEQDSTFCVSLEFTHFQVEEGIRTRDRAIGGR